MDSQEKIKRIFFEIVRVIAAIVILYCIWEVIKVQVLVFQDDEPRFGLPAAQESSAAAAASAPAPAPAAKP